MGFFQRYFKGEQGPPGKDFNEELVKALVAEQFWNLINNHMQAVDTHVLALVRRELVNHKLVDNKWFGGPGPLGTPPDEMTKTHLKEDK